MALDTADCRCVVCNGRFRVEAIHRGRRVACPLCHAEQLPQVIPVAGSGTGRTTRPPTSTYARQPSGVNIRPLATPPTTPVDAASLALFICSGCGFRARVPRTSVEMNCPRCGVTGRAVTGGIPASSGATVIITNIEQQAAAAAAAAAPAPTQEVPVPEATAPWIQRHGLALIGALSVALTIVGLWLVLVYMTGSDDRSALQEARKEVSDLRNDLERLRDQQRRTEADLEAARADLKRLQTPVSEAPGTATSH